MCAAKRSNSNCTKLSEYDELCGRVSEQKELKGFYRAFMSSSTQWLSNLFAGICVQAKIVNMHVREKQNEIDLKIFLYKNIFFRNKLYSIQSKIYSIRNHFKMKFLMLTVFDLGKYSLFIQNFISIIFN